MAFTLYAATIPSYLQILGSVSRLIGKAESFCNENGLEPEALIQADFTASLIAQTSDGQFQFALDLQNSWICLLYTSPSPRDS